MLRRSNFHSEPRRKERRKTQNLILRSCQLLGLSTQGLNWSERKSTLKNKRNKKWPPVIRIRIKSRVTAFFKFLQVNLKILYKIRCKAFLLTWRTSLTYLKTKKMKMMSQNTRQIWTRQSWSARWTMAQNPCSMSLKCKLSELTKAMFLRW